jgi:diguanylate cyclase (GGDEF)-like protein
MSTLTDPGTPDSQPRAGTARGPTPPDGRARRHRLAALGDHLLSRDPRRRIRVTQTCVAIGVTLPALGVLLVTAALGMVPWLGVWLWVASTLAGSAVFYAAIRSGWSERLADPSLTVPQMLFAISCCACGYAIGGPVRGALLPMLMVALMFGIFSLTVRQSLQVCGFAAVLFGTVMWQTPRWFPGTVPAAVEASHFLMLTATMPAVSLLSARLGRMRSRLERQRHELQQALGRIRYLAMRDELTGLVNRREMGQLMAQALDDARRRNAPWCLALIDLDHFKRVNDAHGHPAGDEVLRAFAQEGLQHVRGADTLARWGGEEFMLLMPACPLAHARGVAERLREALSALAIRHGDTALQVTLSAGVVEHQRGESLEALVERVDVALYRAKSQGRNRVLVG